MVSAGAPAHNEDFSENVAFSRYLFGILDSSTTESLLLNITDSIWRNAHAFAQRPAVIYEGQVATYRVFIETAERIAARLVAAGIGRGDCVALSSRNPAAYLTMTLALARIGAISMPFLEGSPDTIVANVLRRHSAVAVVQDSANPWRCEALPELRYLTLLELFAPDPDRLLAPAPVADDVDNDVWQFIMSSGTTGIPKTIPKTHRLKNLEYLTVQNSVMHGEERIMVFLTLTVEFGLKAAIRALMVGSAVVLTPNASPENFFALVQREQPRRAVTSTGFAAKLIAYAAAKLPNARQLCASMQTFIIGGSAASPALVRGIHEYICPQLEISYGSTEIGGMALATNQTLTDRPEAAGRLQPWVHGQAVDDQHRPLPKGEAGILRFKIYAMPMGYLNDDEANARVFRDGWFYPGDTGAVDDQGYVTLAGRVDHLMNLGGVKINPLQIEAVLDTHPGILESAVFAASPPEGGKPFLVAVVVPRAELQMQELKQFCSERLAPQCIPQIIATVKELPKNAGGKVIRAALSDLVRLPPGPIVQA
jgi:long-chain acyl-CoA synthetase